MHGLLPTTSLEDVIRHESGHLLMVWLLGRTLDMCMVFENGGITRVVQSADLETPCERLLYSLAGMVLGGNGELLEELYRHGDEPEFFDIRSDSYYAAEALIFFQNMPCGFVLGKFVSVLRRLRRTYGEAYMACVELLREGRALQQPEADRVFAEWDRLYGLNDNTRLEAVTMELARAFGWKDDK